MTVQAMKAGAVEFLSKPFGTDVLLGGIRQAVERSLAALGHEAEIQTLRERTPAFLIALDICLEIKYLEIKVKDERK
jgi:FixJ family two-component response regulator